MSWHEPRTIQTVRIPVTLCSVIVEHKLAGNDVAILLLILARTMNVSPPRSEVALSIRYIAEQIKCSPKGAENSVNKLKRLKLVTHKVFPRTMKPGLVGLDYEEFRTVTAHADHEPTSVVIGPPIVPALVIEDGFQQDVQTVQEILFERINDRRDREPALPDRFLAADLLDYFGGTAEVEKWITRLHNGWKESRYSPKGYGIYYSSLKKLREADVAKRVWQRVDSIPVTESFTLPERLSARKTISTTGWTIEPEGPVETLYDDHEFA